MINPFLITEIKYKILFYLSYPDILCFSFTCRENYTTLKDKYFWVKKISRDAKYSDRQARYLFSTNKYPYIVYNNVMFDLFSKYQPYFYFYENNCLSLYISSINGYVNQLFYLIDDHQNSAITSLIIKGSIEGGHLHLFKYLISKQKFSREEILEFLELSFYKGNKDIIDHVLTLVNNLTIYEYEELISACLLGGHYNMMYYLNDTVKKNFDIDIISKNNEMLCYDCIKKGDFTLFSLLMEINPHIVNFRFINCVLENSIKFGQLKIFESIYSYFMTKSNINNNIINNPININSYINSYIFDINKKIGLMINADDSLDIIINKIFTLSPAIINYDLRYHINNIISGISSEFSLDDLSKFLELILDFANSASLISFLNNTLKKSISDFKVEISNYLIEKLLIIDRKSLIENDIFSYAVKENNIEVIHNLSERHLNNNIDSFHLPVQIIQYIFDNNLLDPYLLLDNVICTSNFKAIKMLIRRNIFKSIDIIERLCKYISLDQINNSDYNYIYWSSSNSSGSSGSSGSSETIDKDSDYFKQNYNKNERILLYLLNNLPDVDSIFSTCLNHKNFDLFISLIKIYDYKMCEEKKKYSIKINITIDQ